jgi:hypothetical protein
MGFDKHQEKAGEYQDHQQGFRRTDQPEEF